jgi:asparagine synthase (glutamine-hydrolysing)
MCGIAGVVQRDGPLQGDVSALAESLSSSLAHRGPDGAGTWTAPAEAGGAGRNVLLVHRRLAIIDPGPGGSQPMSTRDGRHHIVFNGEIYNYRALRADLESHGEQFTSVSDTEVLLRLVANQGPDSLARVRGMFAFAMWDAAERSLLLARDRFGIKPLYVAAGPRQIAFASEVTALRAANLSTGETSIAGVLAFMRWGSVLPPLTWQRGIDVLAPGTWHRWQLGGSARGEIHGVFADARTVYSSGDRPRRTVEAFRANVGQAVRESVSAHLVADVPVGVFLSGGIDSGSLVSCASSAGAANLQTFTVGFDDESSEVARARMVAERFGTTHHELRIDGAEVARDLPAVLARLDQPTIDAVNSFYVARAVSATGIKAVLSGAGGDELFGGYPSFTRLPRAMALKRLAGPAWPALAPLAGRLMPERLRARWRHFASSNGSFGEAYRVQRGFLLPDEVKAMAGPALRDGAGWWEALEAVRETENALMAPAHSANEESPRATVARLESRLYLGSQLLRDLDVMSMAHALEVRVPFVDHELLEQVWPDLALHPELMQGKQLLSGTLERPLPDAIIQSPKQGFTLPFAGWMRGPLAPVVQDGLRQLADAGWITGKTPERVWSEWRRGAAHWSRPWGLSVLGHCLAARRR